MKLMKTQDKNTQISVYCIQHYCKQNFGIIKQLLPALAVTIIIVPLWDVVFPRALLLARGKTTSQGGTIMMVTLSAGNNCIIFSRGTLNCMDVLNCQTPTAKGNITHPCNSMVGVASVARIDKISKNNEFLILKEIQF